MDYMFVHHVFPPFPQDDTYMYRCGNVRLESYFFG